ncbi:MAG: hypothetical protein K2O14_02860, partial [Oscillospiraceae bacterium]|nr:hypothetical protein [Oscillospiraceae bacterium]
VQYMPETGRELVHYYHLAEDIPAGKNRIYVTLATKTGDCYILEDQLTATILGYGVVGSGNGDVRDRLSIIDTVPPISSLPMGMRVEEITADGVQYTADS